MNWTFAFAGAQVLENRMECPISSLVFKLAKGGGLMSHCHLPNAAMVSAASAEVSA